MKYSEPIKVIEVRQKKVVFYLAKMKPSVLKLVANKSLSRYQNEDGLQREQNQEKIKDIEKYLSTDLMATFPNTIIVSLRDDLNTEKPLYKFDNNGDLLLSLDTEVANVIDGQHRLAAFNDKEDDFELPVSIFLDLSLGEQAKIFSIINSTQTKVSLDLVYENFFQSSIRSQEKVSFFIVKNLNDDTNSPWFKKIKTLSERKGRDMAQGSMAKFIHKNLLDEGKVFYNLYVSERDKDIYSIINNYFLAIKSIFPNEWKNENNDYILTKTTGFVGFMMFFIDILTTSGNQEFTQSFFESKILPAKIAIGKLDSKNYNSGAVGQGKLRRILKENLSN
ncbi:hypothetical protein A2456_03335 [Candidatus Nomurabacteria bacterium RIFOXYC2_FULL_36_19]|uniref:DGQHR domain-containing protein n=3 Tax=Candidatus Nomuraibacteriota TaxID=1752729 RepID=A0A1F6YV95_9BACT|nr:MAG: DGQHR domain protein [Candidatus Nomurabacteria bacterium GW2011_GWC2_35_8]OGJ05685.1 MAG: hypothetical protein A2238_02220 [Candidatus Nomurabacteria bacterium RIFOXYA2_FULL_35_9]OGJ06839.1 MAG: hypothetical protein A2192_00095 [Candidatus Nomurabacteria bacterium RIFOXYA1_FULL_35_17]OGJ10265.1 MAG: hypothetical protein A2456_03335 [Candidatus Nomurabacteria bacterium RIFOXYC2_FULL_36_19]OGJ13764.1 MAG: hypothetical protein A2554_02320 [Candidatus Nomurabacteria bacterium RIFOXYD2_FULL